MSGRRVEDATWKTYGVGCMKFRGEPGPAVRNGTILTL